ncbi:MAG: hypothetical protein ACYDEH_12320 [Acidimicrobiales bacterium]
MSIPRPKWPQEEFELWNSPGYLEVDFDERTASKDGLDAGDLFIQEIAEFVEARVEEFINAQCSAKGVGSPDLRRLARVNLAHAIERYALATMITSAAICREHGLPWAALADVTEAKSVTTFQRRWEAKINTEVANRVHERDQRGPLLGDKNYTGPAATGHPE